MAKTIVILGASFAGLHIAHYLLKHNKDVKVVVVTKNSHFYWNIASVRAIIPDALTDSQIFGSVETALSRYPADRVELVIGAATGVDFAAKTVEVAVAGVGAEAGSARTVAYDQLVLATGSRPAAGDVPWKAAGSYEEVLAQLARTRAAVAAASHIVVAGAGSTGAEVAAELAAAFAPAKEVVLLAGPAGLLGGDAAAAAVTAEFKRLHVEVRENARVASTQTLPDGKTEVLLESGDRIVTDLYLPTLGLLPNSDFLDAKYLNERKNVVVDDVFRLKGADDVWAAGDIASVPRAGFMITQKQAAGVGKNIDLVLKGKQPTAIKGMPIDVFALAMGPNRGAGRAGPVRLLSAMVWMAKSRTLGTQMLSSYVDGSVA